MTSAKPSTIVCVFCGSSFGNKPGYANDATELGQKLAHKGWGVVYGGGTTGVMGAVARGCATNGGYVHGIIPEALISRERTEESAEDLNQKLKESIDNHDGSTPLPDSKEYETDGGRKSQFIWSTSWWIWHFRKAYGGGYMVTA